MEHVSYPLWTLDRDSVVNSIISSQVSRHRNSVAALCVSLASHTVDLQTSEHSVDFMLLPPRRVVLLHLSVQSRIPIIVGVGERSALC